MGYIGQVHREACRKIPGAQVVAVATLDPEKIRGTFCGQIYTHYEELLQDTRLDAIVIGLPTDLHEKAVVMAAECGRHILCEKPMALNAASARRMIEAAQAHERILMVGHVLRFWAQYARIKELIDAGEIGSPISIAAYRLSKFPPWMDWFRNAERSGGTLLDLQVHDIDFIHWILGHPQSVYTVGIESTSGCWDHVHTILTYPDAQASIEASSLMPESFPFTTRVLVLGTEGALEYTFRVGANIQERASASHSFRLYKSDGRQCEPAASTEDAYVAQLRYFVHCVAHHQPPNLCPPEESCQVIQVMDAARQSAETGRIIALAA